MSRKDLTKFILNEMVGMAEESQTQHVQHQQPVQKSNNPNADKEVINTLTSMIGEVGVGDINYSGFLSSLLTSYLKNEETRIYINNAAEVADAPFKDIIRDNRDEIERKIGKA